MCVFAGKISPTCDRRWDCRRCWPSLTLKGKIIWQNLGLRSKTRGGASRGEITPKSQFSKIMLTIMVRVEPIVVVDWRGGGERSNKEDRIMIPARWVNVANLLFWDCILSMNESNVYENLSCVSCHILPLPLTFSPSHSVSYQSNNLMEE